MESEKCHDLPSASWRAERAGGIDWLKSKGLRTGSAKDSAKFQLKQLCREG